eukprot:6199293-Pleurochrysis_carterae.AAC.3
MVVDGQRRWAVQLVMPCRTQSRPGDTPVGRILHSINVNVVSSTSIAVFLIDGVTAVRYPCLNVMSSASAPRSGRRLLATRGQRPARCPAATDGSRARAPGSTRPILFHLATPPLVHDPH